ncbi:MAG: FtsX-like permease family protein, partial [Acidimicrobiales bacterium]
VKGPIGLALANLARRPARLVAGALGLFFGVAAFAMLLGIDLSFKGAVTGSVLGNAISVQVRSVDFVAAALAIVLGAASVADVMVVNLRERASEAAVLAATGWSTRLLATVAFGEGMTVGLTGSVAGGLVGLVLAGVLTGKPLAVLGPAVLATAAGIVLVVFATLVPAVHQSRRPPAPVLAEE